MLTPTTHEIQALTAILEEAIVQSRDDDGDPVFHEVSLDSVNPFGDKVTQSNVYDSLAKQGLVECSVMEDVLGKVEEFVCITPEGLEALKSAQGVH